MGGRTGFRFRAAVVTVLALVMGQAMSLHAAGERLTLRPDEGFGVDGTQVFEGWQETTNIYPRDQGRSLVVLKRRSSEGIVLESGVVRLLADGSTDPSFAISSAVPGLVEGSGDRSVVVLDDGSFMFDTRRFTASGDPDLSFGLNGYVAVDGEDPAELGGSYVALFELGDGSLGMVRSGCFIDHIPNDGFMELPVVLDLPCDTARAAALSDGRTALLIAKGVEMHLIVLAPDGDVMSVGDVPQDIGSACTPLISVTGASASRLVVLGGASSGTQLCALGLDGNIDTAFGVGGFVPIDGVANAVHADAQGVTVGVWYTFHLRPGAPYTPAVLRLTADGRADSSFGASAAEPGWVDIRDLGVEQPALGAPIAVEGDGTVWFPLAMSTGTGTNSVIDPIAAMLRTVSVTIRPFNGPADVSRPATRQNNAHTVN